MKLKKKPLISWLKKIPKSALKLGLRILGLLSQNCLFWHFMSKRRAWSTYLPTFEQKSWNARQRLNMKWNEMLKRKVVKLARSLERGSTSSKTHPFLYQLHTILALRSLDNKKNEESADDSHSLGNAVDCRLLFDSPDWRSVAKERKDWRAIVSERRWGGRSVGKVAPLPRGWRVRMTYGCIHLIPI